MERIVPIATLKAVYIIHLTLLSHADEFWGQNRIFFGEHSNFKDMGIRLGILDLMRGQNVISKHVIKVLALTC